MNSALKLAFKERCHREFNDRKDEFSEADEELADEILALLPEAGA